MRGSAAFIFLRPVEHDSERVAFADSVPGGAVLQGLRRETPKLEVVG